ncbi:MAG TPA: BON domain-containing protein [Acidimicrobiales bacterium]|nr:BON domain-containing protein [Acidimicrobiales bacterium]
MTVEPDDYVIQRVRDALAADERVAEMGVEVRIAAGKVFLTGQVPTEERRQAVGVVAAEVVAEYEVHNETVVTELGDHPRVERIT